MRKRSKRSLIYTNTIINVFGAFKKLIKCLSSALLVTTGTIVGGVTLNPIILGTISGAGILLKTVSEAKNYKRKIEMAKFANTTYEKTLITLRAGLRGAEFDKDDFVTEMRLLDEIISDFSPLVYKYEKQYTRQFTSGQ